MGSMVKRMGKKHEPFTAPKVGPVSKESNRLGVIHSIERGYYQQELMRARDEFARQKLLQRPSGLRSNRLRTTSASASSRPSANSTTSVSSATSPGVQVTSLRNATNS